RDDVSRGLLESAEREHIVVGDLAFELLNRFGSAPEKDAWTAYLDAHARRIDDLARLFLGSAEVENETEAEAASGSRPPAVLRLDDGVTLPLPTGPMTAAQFAELFSGYPLPPSGGPALVNQLLGVEAATAPVTSSTASGGMVPLYVTYTGPAPDNLPGRPITVAALD